MGHFTKQRALGSILCNVLGYNSCNVVRPSTSSTSEFNILICLLQCTRMSMYTGRLRGRSISVCVCLSVSNEAVKRVMPSWHRTPANTLTTSAWCPTSWPHQHTNTFTHARGVMHPVCVRTAWPPAFFYPSRTENTDCSFMEEHAERWMADHSDHSTEAIMLPQTRCHCTTSWRKLSRCNRLFICFILMGAKTPGWKWWKQCEIGD